MITLSKPIRAVLFDVDGTLVNTETHHLQAFAELLQPFGIDCTADFYKNNISGKANNDLHGLLPHLSHAEATAFFDRKEAHFRATAAHILDFTPGLVQLLNDLARAHVQLGIVSNAPRANVDMILRGLRARTDCTFQVIVSGEDVTAAKPNPEPYLQAMRLLGVAPAECIVFEDSVSGVRSGVAAGCRTVGITTTQSVQELVALGCSEAIANFTEVAVGGL